MGVDYRGCAYVVGPWSNLEELQKSTRTPLVIQYADGHGQRLLNKIPFEFDETLVTDANGRTWDVIGRSVWDFESQTYVHQGWGTF